MFDILLFFIVVKDSMKAKNKISKLSNLEILFFCYCSSLMTLMTNKEGLMTKLLRGTIKKENKKYFLLSALNPVLYLNIRGEFINKFFVCCFSSTKQLNKLTLWTIPKRFIITLRNILAMSKRLNYGIVKGFIY